METDAFLRELIAHPQCDTARVSQRALVHREEREIMTQDTPVAQTDAERLAHEYVNNWVVDHRDEPEQFAEAKAALIALLDMATSRNEASPSDRKEVMPHTRNDASRRLDTTQPLAHGLGARPSAPSEADDRPLAEVVADLRAIPSGFPKDAHARLDEMRGAPSEAEVERVAYALVRACAAHYGDVVMEQFDMTLSRKLARAALAAIGGREG